MRDDRRRSPGLRVASARLAASLLALLRTRVELASVEFSEERARLQQQLVLLVAGLVSLLFAVFFVAVWVIVYFWDTYRLTAIAGVVLAFGLAGAIVLWRRAESVRTAPTPFAATLAELERDRESFSISAPPAP
jgi:uncharacterized membrane protein YqjE